jgi:hypothetical protein
VIAYDDSDDYTFIWEEELLKLGDANRNPETLRRRSLRQALRAAERSGALFDAPYDCTIMKTVPDGEKLALSRHAFCCAATPFVTAQAPIHTRTAKETSEPKLTTGTCSVVFIAEAVDAPCLAFSVQYNCSAHVFQVL